MSLLSPYIEAEHHREAATALLRCLVPHGQRGAFSKQVGISASHLSQILGKRSAGCAPGEVLIAWAA